MAGSPLDLLAPLALAFGALAAALALAHVGIQARILRLSPEPAGAWRPFASIVVPCRGLQHGLEENARAFASQAYGAHEVLFVVDDRADPSVPTLEKVAREHPHVRVLVSEPDAVGRDWPVGKMVAQRTGALRADPRSEALVFADADGRPGPRWLASLVAPLEDPKVGVVTGYRWYVPATRLTPWVALRDAFDHMVAGGFGNPKVTMVWGGAMALRRADFDRPEVAEEWRRCISDDLGITNAVSRWRLRIAFAPGGMVEAPEDQTGAQVAEFLTRQVAINRASHAWMFKLTSLVFLWSSAALALGLALLALRPSPELTLAGLLLLLPSALQTLRAAFIDRLAHRALPSLRARPPRERLATLLLAPLMPWFTLWVYARARRLKEVTWRGRRYALRPGAVEALR